MSDSDSVLLPFQNLVKDSGIALSEEARDELLRFFVSSGAENIDDLKYIDEQDLGSILPLVKRKKFFTYIQSVTTAKSLTDHDSSVNCSSETDTEDGSVKNFIDPIPPSYDFPWERIPFKMKKWLGSTRPNPAERQHFVRVVTDHIMEFNCRPTRETLRAIAKKLVSMFPLSLKTVGLSGTQSGDDPSHYSLLRQMEQRVINQCRYVGVSRDRDDKKRPLDHGCKQFSPQSEISPEELEQARLAMITLYQEEHPLKPESVEVEISKVFPKLRKILNSGEKIGDVKKNWPLLFTLPGIYSHYDMLVDGSNMEIFKSNYLKQVPELTCYLQSLQAKNIGISRTCIQVAEAKRTSGHTNQPEVFGLLLMLIKYFKEDEEALYRKDECDVIPATPCLITQGKPILTASRFSITLDKEVIIRDIGSPVEALAVFFATYFVFNVQYPDNLSITMQFLESQIAAINKSSGVKKSRSTSKRASIDGIPIQILTLLDGYQYFREHLRNDMK